MRLSNIALAISVIYGGVFTPASLFANGEQGAWYDPSDLTTLFQDSAGTTPVTGVEQFVGLMLDKSKGLVLGSEIAPSTNYSSGWTTQSGVALPGTTAVYTSVASNNGAYFGGGANIVAGRFYEVTYTISSLTAGGLAVYIGGTPSTVTRTVAGTYTERIGTVATDGFVTLRAVGTTTAVISSFSIKQVTGNHATSTGTKRPKLAARYNLLTYTEQFDNTAEWDRTTSPCTVNANTVTAPDGTTTADTIIPTTGNSVHALYSQNKSFVNGTTYRQTLYVQAAGYNFWQFTTGLTGDYINFNLSTKQVGNSTAFFTGTIQDVGGGWCKCEVTFTSSLTSNQSIRIVPLNADTAARLPSFAGDGTSGIYIWGADLRPASQATGLIGPTYQRVVDAATYDTAGFLPYLQFDGIDDSMSTGSIDFTATDKMTVWAGVRKLSDAAVGAVTELSAALNDGCFSILAPRTAADNRSTWTSRGTASSNAITNNLPAPISFVITGIGDIAGDISSVRTDGVLRATNTADQGTGNYGNHPLFIGQRGGSTLPFNGWLTSLIVRGAQSTQSQIEATEAWVNGKTGAF
jgi:hypothetical protein